MKNQFNKLTLLFFLLLTIITGKTFAHGGEDHGGEKPKTAATEAYFSSENNSEIYEVLIKYGEVVSGEDTHLTLFLSDEKTNKPIANATLIISNPDDENQKFEVVQKEAGIYEIHTKFTKNQKYDLNISINASLGADLIQIADIEVGKKLPKPTVAEETKTSTSFFSTRNIITIAIALFIGVLAGLFFRRNTKMGQKAISILLVAIMLLAPVSTVNVYAHGGEDHGDGKKSTGSSGSSEILVPKETQFLFDINTLNLTSGNFDPSINLFGTILPTSSGKAVVQTPQTGIIKSLSASVGQNVTKGQTLAVIEQNIDANTQVDWLTQKNSLGTELRAAKKEYDRINTIADIAAKRDVDEAERRYNTAVKNLNVFTRSNGSNNSSLRTIYLKAPISGKIDNFNFALGSSVNAGQDIFTITNLNKLYIEAQVFDKDVNAVKNGKEFTAECTDNHKALKVKLLTLAQSINTTNQSQKVLFEIDNVNQDFKIGEFVNVRVFSQAKAASIAVPNSAITEVNGKSAIFIKDTAEKYTLVYVSLGENNGQLTTILKGIEEGEKVVINGTYQLKMMFLNQ
jgi:RND family efflux transporter MFP subunit